MRRLGVAALIAAIVLGDLPFAHAGWLRKWCANFCRDYKRNKMWPEPFIIPDRNATMAPFAVMVANGWREQNTLTDEHFDDDSSGLSESGRLKIADIMYNSPTAYRSIFVDKTDEPSTTAARVAAAQEYAAHLADDSEVPPVIAIHARKPAAPADYVENIYRQFEETTPPPRLPEDDASSSSSGASGASGS